MKPDSFLHIIKYYEKDVPIQLFYAEQVEGEKQYEKKNVHISLKHQTTQHLFRFPFLKTF